MNWIVYATLALAFVGVGLLIAKLGGAAFSWWWVVGALAPFLLLVVAIARLAWLISKAGH